VLTGNSVVGLCFLCENLVDNWSAFFGNNPEFTFKKTWFWWLLSNFEVTCDWLGEEKSFFGGVEERGKMQIFLPSLPSIVI
jgi:hypothetical protein